MNKFYGKHLNELSPMEIDLLMIDLQMSKFRKLDIENKDEILNEFNMMRIKIVTICTIVNSGGDYSRIRFVQEFEKKENEEINDICLN